MGKQIVLESSLNHATITDSGISPTLPTLMGGAIGFAPQASGYMADNLAYEVEKSPSLIVNQKIGVIVISEDANRKEIL